MPILLKINLIQTPSSKFSSPLFSREYAQCLQQHFLRASSSHLTELLRNTKIFWTPVIYRMTCAFFHSQSKFCCKKRINVHAKSSLLFQWHPKWYSFWFSHRFTQLYLIKKSGKSWNFLSWEISISHCNIKQFI